MTTRNRLQAEQSLKGYTRRHKPISITAALGTNGGVVDHPTRGDGWVYARLHGDPNQIVVVREEGAVPHVADVVVELEEVRKTASSYYRVKGLASQVVYSTNPWTQSVGPHAWTHQRVSGQSGGTDPVDVYARMVVPLRARAQATPDLTVYVEAGYNPLTGNYYAGGSSAAVVVPAGAAQARYDLLYLADDDTLNWVTGVAVVGSTPTRPAVPAPSVPLAYVYLANGQTTIEEHDFHLDPGILRSAVGTALPVTLLDTEADIMATALTAGRTAFSTDTHYHFVCDGTWWWKSADAYTSTQTGHPIGLLLALTYVA